MRPPLFVDLGPPAGVFQISEDVHAAGPGGALWDASCALAHYVARLPSELLRSASVVELGAGTGLPSLVAARLGASVVCTDRRRALPLLQHNAALNGLEARVSCAELEWGASVSLPPCSLVLAADCVCHEESYRPLLATLLSLTQGNALCLLANKCRSADEHSFWESVAESFTVELLEAGISELDRDGDGLCVSIYGLRRRTAS